MTSPSSETCMPARPSLSKKLTKKQFSTVWPKSLGLMTNRKKLIPSPEGSTL